MSVGQVFDTVTKTKPPYLPSDLGAPDKFAEWRPHQYEALDRAINSDKRFIVLALPTGIGKTLVYMLYSMTNGVKASILTATKVLQDQLMDDFSEVGLVDIRGQNNYPCKLLQPGGSHYEKRSSLRTCDHGPCHHNVECQYKKERNPNTAQQDYELAGCDYFDALSIANSSSLVATNYAYWMHRGKYMRERSTRSEGKYGNRFGLGASNVLICDEAHHATTELSNFLKINLYAEFT